MALGTVEPVKMPTVGSIGSGVASLGSGAAGASAAPPAKEAAAEVCMYYTGMRNLQGWLRV